MRVLLIKTSSMGDLIHTLPALTDAGNALPNISFDWIAEESFAEIPLWHPRVNKVIPVALRRWRKNIFSTKTRAEWRQFRAQLAAQDYDVILDAQALVKSAFLAYFAKGQRVGLDWGSAREALASLVYQKKHTVNFYQHAVVRMRTLFSLALGYPLPATAPDFGLDKPLLRATPDETNYVVFLHGTTWTTKLWPETYWVQLAQLAAAAGYRIKISGGSEEEIARAHRIAAQCSAVDVMPRLQISTMGKLLASAKAAIAVDTGFGHLAGALGIPTISLYGATNAAYTGALGPQATNLSTQFPCSPCLSRTCTYKTSSAVTPACYTTLPPELVWQKVQNNL
jgi:heptosyltransferase-1